MSQALRDAAQMMLDAIDGTPAINTAGQWWKIHAQAEIQFQYRNCTWQDVGIPYWDEHVNYRVKPQKKKGWIAIHSLVMMNGGQDSGLVWPTKEECLMNNPPKGDNKRIAIVEFEYEEGQGLETATTKPNPKVSNYSDEPVRECSCCK